MRYIILITMLLAFNGLIAQISFLEESQHTITPHSIQPANGFQWNDTTYFVLYKTYYGLGHHSPYIVQYDELGKKTNEFTPMIHYGGAIADGLQKIGSNKFFLKGSGDDSLGRFTTFNYMYDSSWSVIWSKGYDYRYRELSPINDSVGFASVQIRNVITGVSALNLNTGDTIWTKSYNRCLNYPEGVNTGYFFANLTTNESFVYTLFQKNTTDSNVIVVLDHYGNWVRNDTVISPVLGQTVVKFNNGYIFFDRSTSGSFTQVQFIENGQLKWSKEFSYFGLYPFVVNSNKIGVLLQTKLNSESVGSNCRIVHLDSLGNTLKTFDLSDPDYSFGISSISKTQDEGWFATCTSTRFYQEHFILKTDSDGFVSNPTLFPLEIDTNQGVFIEEIDLLESHPKIYPNPSNGQFTVETIDVINSISVYNLMGQQIPVIVERNSSKSVKININNPGFYIVTIIAENHQYSSKIIVK